MIGRLTDAARRGPSRTRRGWLIGPWADRHGHGPTVRVRRRVRLGRSRSRSRFRVGQGQARDFESRPHPVTRRRGAARRSSVKISPSHWHCDSRRRAARRPSLADHALRVGPNMGLAGWARGWLLKLRHTTDCCRTSWCAGASESRPVRTSPAPTQESLQYAGGARESRVGGAIRLGPSL